MEGVVALDARIADVVGCPRCLFAALAQGDAQTPVEHARNVDPMSQLLNLGNRPPWFGWRSHSGPAARLMA